MAQIPNSLNKQPTIAIVGLGYVGLPLAVEFGKKMHTIGFDLSVEKVEAYRHHIDFTGELSAEELKAASQLCFDTNPEVLQKADFIIIAVPTPITSSNQPDLTALVESSKIVGQHLKQGAIIVFDPRYSPEQRRNCVFHFRGILVSKVETRLLGRLQS